MRDKKTKNKAARYAQNVEESFISVHALKRILT